MDRCKDGFPDWVAYPFFGLAGLLMIFLALVVTMTIISLVRE